LQRWHQHLDIQPYGGPAGARIGDFPTET